LEIGLSMSANPLLTDQYWSQTPVALFQILGSSINGLAQQEAQNRLERIGPNRLQDRKRASNLVLFINQFKSPITLILLFATGISALLRDWIDSLIILVIVFSSAILSFIQEYNANNASEKLRSQIATKSDVVRDGKNQTIPSWQVVPGDIVLLSAGSLVPADGLVLEAKDFFVDQAALTGESLPVEKYPALVSERANLAERTNTVFMGTNVRSGSAHILVVQTGKDAAFGKIASHLTLRPPENEFERGIRRLGYLLSEIMLIMVLAIFFFNVFFHKPVLDSLLFSVALAVGLTPQLLPAIININLSKGSQAMAKQGVIVRRLESIENFGSMDLLCTDKTGTLTEGVVRLDAAMDSQGQPSDPVLHFAYLNAHFQTGLPNPLDEAILSGEGPEISRYIKVDEIPYDFTRKRLSVVVQGDNKGLTGAPLLITKGALENVLSVCIRVAERQQFQPIDETRSAQIRQLYSQWSEQGFRVLGVAIKEITRQSSYSFLDEDDMTFVGFLLFFDPPKAGIHETLEQLKQLGVRLKIITGDNRLVARHIAQAIGLGDISLLTGAELDELHDDALWHAAEQTDIFAEIDPNQKERIILALKKNSHVVGYMGDGINDAPSLHTADVGISVANAMDVAKEAADLVLLKQDLSVLEQGILLGRKTFANTLKYVFMASSANFGNMFSMAAASLFLPFLPMLPKQILLINFLTDLPEIAIASDHVDTSWVDRPRRWDIAFIRRFMLVFGPLSSIFDLLTFGFLLWAAKTDQVLFHTGWFIESVISAGIVVFAVRTRLPFLRSRPSQAMLVMTLLVAGIALVLPYTPLAELLGFSPLPLTYLLPIFGIVGLYFLSAELAKRWFYQRFENQ
jgi:Mg2+-importing ATPase